MQHKYLSERRKIKFESLYYITYHYNLMLSIGVCCSPGPEDFPTGWSYQQTTSGVIQQHGHLHPASIYKQMNKKTHFKTNVFYEQ